nr:FkbM family methyltransferase [uncultured Lichenicoccus sp.]
MTFISYAQNFEDVLLWRAIGDIERGFYIDVGAYHPDTHSVTRAFYDRGWSGVNIEPLPDAARRLAAARPRDVTLRIALGAQPAELPFHRVEGTGLSTLDPAIAGAHAAAGLAVARDSVAVLTLAEICALHAAPDIHFLKIDVEGAEHAVLQGADLVRYRPWIILVEATAPNSTTETHRDWEPLLVAAEYDFVWFDGLNRYYVARERLDALAPAFRVPPNVFDDFLRAGDSIWIERAARLQADIVTLHARADLAERHAEAATEQVLLQREAARHESSRLREALGRHQTDADRAGQLRIHDLAAERAALHQARHELQQTHLRLQEALHELAVVRTSTSWRLTAPMRIAVRRTRRLIGSADRPYLAPVTAAVQVPEAERVPEPPADEGQDEATTIASLPPLPITPPPPFLTSPALQTGGLSAVHQFHSGSAVNDAITNAMLLTRSLLRAMGYHSEIFVEEPPAALAGDLLPMEALPRHDGYVLIVRHSMGYDRFEQILALPAPKILLYHNITPPELLVRHPYLARYARLGRRQLATFRGRVAAALADSEYNANELRGLGIAPVRACTLLFDLDALRRRAARATHGLRETGRFTILFVGRINASKGQAALVEAYADFRTEFDHPSRLVLVGHHDAADDAYARTVRQAIARHGLDADIVLAGSVADDTLHEWYAAADLYVSLSRHEGFGVPLVEAMVHGVPVLAYSGGAVPYTLGMAADLLIDTAPATVAAAILRLARDPDARAARARAQDATLGRFALDRQRAVLADALLRAGAALPAEPQTVPLLEANLRLSIAGHVNGSYSLAAINRDLARALDEALPGRVRLLPVEGGPTLDLSGVPPDEQALVSALVHRPPHATGPELVVSQHYPVHVPRQRGDATVAMLFWEESLLPAATIELLGRNFDAVVAPTRFVRDALVGSGLAIPVRVIPPALRLERFAALRRERPEAPAPVHRFLHVSSCFPRKGVDVLLRAWAAAFRAGDSVRLVIKGFPNPHNDVAAQIADLLASDPDVAPIQLVDADLDGEALLALYRDADTMVLPTRGEGYNLPAAEALAAGLGLIVTGRGGHMDFCTGPDGPLPEVRLLRYRPARSGSHVATPHSLWLEPDHEDLVAALREQLAATGRSGTRRLADAASLADAWSRMARDLLLRRPFTGTRISWVSSWDVRCGIAEYSRHLLETLTDATGEHSVRVRILCDRRTSIDEAEPEAPVRMPEVWPCWEAGDPRSVEPLANAIAADDAPAVVLQHQPGLLSFATLAALINHRALLGRVVVAALHNTRDLLDLSAAERQVVIHALRRIDAVLVHTVADLLRLQSLGLEANTILLPHGVARPLPAPPVRALDVLGTPMIGCYGFFLPGKGIDVLIEAFAILRQQMPRARLLLVNAEYEHPHSAREIERCRRLAADLGVEDAIVFETAFLAQRRSLELLTGCDVLALPYRPSKEAASGALRIALASGVAVAVTPIELFAEAGGAVFRFAALDAASVAEGLAGLLADLTARVALQSQAQEWIAARQWPDLARRLGGMLTGMVRTRALEGEA